MCTSHVKHRRLSFVLDSVYAVMITFVPFVVITIFNLIIIRKLLRHNRRRRQVKNINFTFILYIQLLLSPELDIHWAYFHTSQTYIGLAFTIVIHTSCLFHHSETYIGLLSPQLDTLGFLSPQLDIHWAQFHHNWTYWAQKYIELTFTLVRHTLGLLSPQLDIHQACIHHSYTQACFYHSQTYIILAFTIVEHTVVMLSLCGSMPSVMICCLVSYHCQLLEFPTKY